MEIIDIVRKPTRWLWYSDFSFHFSYQRSEFCYYFIQELNQIQADKPIEQSNISAQMHLSGYFCGEFEVPPPALFFIHLSKSTKDMDLKLASKWFMWSKQVILCFKYCSPSHGFFANIFNFSVEWSEVEPVMVIYFTIHRWINITFNLLLCALRANQLDNLIKCWNMFSWGLCCR